MNMLELAQANVLLAELEPAAIIQWAVEQFGRRIVIGTSFGRNSGYLLRKVHEMYPWMDALFADPGDVPFSNYYYYGKTIAERMPDLAVHMYQNDTELSEADKLAIETGGAARLEVYARRKLPLIRRGIEENGAVAILYGRRFDQLEDGERSRFRHVNPDERGNMRIYPSLYTSEQEVGEFLFHDDLVHPDGLPKGFRDNCGFH